MPKDSPLRKIKISARLSISFFIFLFITVVIAAVSIISLNMQSSFDRSIINNNTLFLNLLKKLSYTNATLALHYNEIGKKNVAIRENTPSYVSVVEARKCMEDLVIYSEDYIKAVKDVIKSEESKTRFFRVLDNEDIISFQNNIENITGMIGFLQSDYFREINSFLDAALGQNDLMKQYYFSRLTSSMVESIDMAINKAYDSHVLASDRSLERVHSLAALIRMLIVATVLLLLTVSIILILLISNSINNPLRSLVEITDKIAHGNLDVEVNDKSKDEISLLNKSYRTLIERITALQGEIKALANCEMKGEKYRLPDELHFEGVFIDIFYSIHQIIDNEEKITGQIMDSISAIVDGDFKAELNNFPGEKFKFNIAVENLRKNIKGVNSEISRLIKAAIDGNFKTRDVNNTYTGDWRELIGSLNRLMEVWETYLDIFPEALLILDKNLNQVYSNRLYDIYFGENPIMELILGDEYVQYGSSGLSSLNLADGHHFYQLTTGKGEDTKYFSVTFTPIAENGETISFFVLAADITDLVIEKERAMEASRARNEMVQKVHYDSLTGIYNRRYLDENLGGIIKTISRSGGVLSLFMIDIDFFKNFNDTYGHSEGDTCLKKVAKALSGCITRSEDFVVRYGGEEFFAVLPNTDKAGALSVAEKMLAAVRKLRIRHEKSDAASHVTVSIGIATGKANFHKSAEEYIKSADDMLYQSKKTGRNKISLSSLD